MTIARQRTKGLIKKCAGALMGTFLAYSLLPMSTAYADLIEYSFTGTDGAERALNPSNQYANPVGVVTFALSAGVDRKVRISILNEKGEVISTSESHLLNAEDRIEVSGQ